MLNEKDEAVQLCSSVECKGIIGNDGRHYILDLLRTFPPDLNFLPVEGEELPPETQKQGFPRLHRHRLACLRQELIEAFVEHRWGTINSGIHNWCVCIHNRCQWIQKGCVTIHTMYVTIESGVMSKAVYRFTIGV